MTNLNGKLKSSGWSQDGSMVMFNRLDSSPRSTSKKKGRQRVGREKKEEKKGKLSSGNCIRDGQRGKA